MRQAHDVYWQQPLPNSADKKRRSTKRISSWPKIRNLQLANGLQVSLHATKRSCSISSTAIARPVFRNSSYQPYHDFEKTKRRDAGFPCLLCLSAPPKAACLDSAPKLPFSFV